MREEVTRWIWGGLVAVIGLVGLFLAAKAQDFPFELFGILLFLFAVAFNFGLIGRFAGKTDPEA